MILLGIVHKTVEVLEIFLFGDEKGKREVNT